MKWRGKLSSHLLISAVALTLAVTVIVFFGSFVGYWVLFTYFPDEASTSMMPSGLDWLMLLLLLMLPLVIASTVSLKLAKNIVTPISSLAAAAKDIADGNLSARAKASPGASNELSRLVVDFNTMADVLQDSAARMSVWNAAVAHEIRTPLTVLKGRVQGLLDGVFAADRKTLEGLMMQIDSLARLTDDLRTVTLADNGELELRIAPVSASEEIAKVVDMVGPSLEQSGFSIVLNLSDVWVAADAMRIRQAMLALLTNVQQHANPGVVRISSKSARGSVVISVEDSGPGLPADFIKRVFKPFMRTTKPTSWQRGGSGLGLAVVRAIALAHGGRANYRRSDLGGSAFIIRFPVSGN